MLTDTHAHITEDVFGGESNVIKDMSADGLGNIICVGYDIRSSLDSVRAATADERIYAAVGVHPYYPETVTGETLELLKILCGFKKVVAVGEIGLDYHHDEYDRDGQIRALIAQYDLACEVGLPVIFHIRDGFGDFYEFAKDRKFPFGGVMHCFSGSKETAEICLKKGLYIAFGGKITYRNSTNLVRAAEAVPLDRLLIETDSPYLTPAQHMGEPNHPRNVAFVRDRLAEIKGVSPEEIERITTENAKKLFFRMK